jgi:hypothetical protein
MAPTLSSREYLAGRPSLLLQNMVTCPGEKDLDLSTRGGGTKAKTRSKGGGGMVARMSFFSADDGEPTAIGVERSAP